MTEKNGRRRVAILGSTGSIGENALDVIRRLPDALELVGVAGKSRIGRLAEQCVEFGCSHVVCAEPRDRDRLRSLLPSGASVYSGVDGLTALATAPDVDIVLCAIVGTSGLVPTMEAIKAGKSVALASKEILVMAGSLVMALAREHGVAILPVDSEHNAIFQCLEGKSRADIARLVLTASGGPFRDWSAADIARATFEDALAHPTWDMGPKVTVDSATLMNKALEIIEAHWLFDVPGDKIDVLIHPDSIAHSFVEFVDGSFLAQLSEPDMRFPIQYALTYPRKFPSIQKRLDLTKIGCLRFAAPDRNRFPSLDFAYEALRVGGTLPAVMNAVNEVAFEAFREGRTALPGIWKLIDAAFRAHVPVRGPDLNAILDADREARRFAAERLSKI